MRRFDGTVRVEARPNGRDWELLAPLTYISGPLTVVVPKGFVTDFASTPRVLWPLVPPTGRYTRAAVVHDYLYRSGVTSRVLADAVFLEAMGVLEAKRWRRWLMYLSVRAFGWVAYRKT